MQFDLNDQARWESMFTYSAGVRGAITSTMNLLGSAAMLDDDEDKVDSIS
jgi:hypothetical protein